MIETLSVGCQGYKKYVSIGVYEEERRLKCLLEFNCCVTIDTGKSQYAGYNTLDYITLVEQIEKSCVSSFHILEELGSDIINRICSNNQGILKIELEIRKCHPLWNKGQGSVFVKLIKDFTSSSV
jgi:dihydroneopterin aldolase